MPNDPILHMLGLARKAGRLEIGEEPVGAVCRVMLHTDVWDYTGEWGNLAGLVCPKYTLYWFLLCGWVIFVLRCVESTVYHPQKSLSDGTRRSTAPPPSS